MSHDIVNIGVTGEPVSVVSALLRQPGTNRVLLGVRRSVATSGRHPDVLSTLTMRIPDTVLDAVLIEATGSNARPSVGETLSFDDPDYTSVGEPEGFRLLSVFLVEALLARKLEVGSLLVQGVLRGRVRPIGVATDHVDDPKGGFERELTTMVTFEVLVDAGSDLLPTSTSSYSPLAWVDGSTLGKAVSTHDALLLLPDADPFEVCLHGLCVRSAATLLRLDDERITQ